MTRAASAAVLLAATVVLAGCGSDDGKNADQRGSTEEDIERAGPAQSGAAKLRKIGTFTEPLYVTAPPRDKRRLFVVQQGGRIRVLKDGKLLSRSFLNLTSRVTAGGEQGLLSMAFAPDYKKSRRFYVNYTDKQGFQRIVEFRRAKRRPSRALPNGRLVLKYDGLESNHNGGLIMFGPDKLLYAGTGDGGGGNDQHGAAGNAQNINNVLGKILRINPRRKGSRRYTSAADNPFVGRQGRNEIYSYGLRNPWRFSFDRATGDLAIGDVGQSEREEINFARQGEARGVNYGWRPWEGTRRNFPGEDAPGHVRPVIELDHDDNNCSVTGGYVVRDRRLPALAGRYVYGDLCKGQLRSARLSPGNASNGRSLGLPKVSGLASFGEDARGRVYVVSLSGPVYRLSPP